MKNYESDLSTLNIYIPDGRTQMGFLAWVYPDRNSLIFYSDEEDTEKLKSLVRNPEDYAGNIFCQWHIKEGKILKESELEKVSAEELRKIIGIDFIVRNSELIRVHNSINSLFDELSGNSPQGLVS